ncbi:MAG: hypothetical protein IPI46_11700 [Bacteroidetes bacterium]|nr:hypothetical protein [Bacteroidota bacterium]
MEPQQKWKLHSWSPLKRLSASNIAEPLATSTTTTIYTVTVTNVGGCTSTDAVIVTVDKTPPVANAGVDRNLVLTQLQLSALQVCSLAIHTVGAQQLP